MGATIDLNLVAMFVAVADGASFSAAARALGVPTSTVSRAVASLEESLGVQLLQRTTRHVSLTAEGASLYERVAPGVGSVRAALGAMPEREEPEGLVRVTAAPDIGATFLAEAVARFTALHPLVRVDVWITSRKVDLVRDGFDAAIRGVAGALEDSSLVARKLAPIEFQIFASPSYLARRGAPRTERTIAPTDWVEFRGWKHPRHLAGLAGSARIVGDDFFFLREAIRAGAGMGFLPTFLARADTLAGSLERVLPDVCRSGGRLVMLHPKQKRMPRRVSAFRDFLLESFAASPLA